MTHKTIGEDEFITRFKPETNEDGSYYKQREWRGGDKAVLTQAAKEGRIWTLVDGDEGDPVIISGNHGVNYIYSIITQTPVPEDESYEVLDEVVEDEDDEDWK